MTSFTNDKGVSNPRNTECSDGGILISYNEPQETFGANATVGFELVKYDSCGNREWQKHYERAAAVLTYETVARLENNAGFIITGRIRFGLNAYAKLFVMRLDTEGEIALFKHYTFDHRYGYGYNIHTDDDDFILTCKFNLDISSLPLTALIKFDFQGNIIWSRHFFNTGFGINSHRRANGNMICRSFNIVFEVQDTDGQLLWGKQYQDILDGSTFFKLVEMSDGYVFSVDKGAYVYLVKTDFNGDVLWKSKGLAVNYYTSLEKLDEQTLVLNSRRSVDGSTFIYILKFNGEGELLNQYKVDAVEDAFYHGHSTIYSDGSHNLSYAFGESINNLLFIRNTFASDCLEEVFYEEVEMDGSTNYTILDNSSVITINPMEVVSLTGVTEENIELVDAVLCEVSFDTDSVRSEGKIDCESTFYFEKPKGEDASYLWLHDGSTEGDHYFSEEGVYPLMIQTCNRKYYHEVEIKSICHCDLQIPNAFSPNNDNLNDVFQVYSACDIDGFSIKIYNRWGNLVYESQDPLEAWDGTAKGEKLEGDAYVYKIEYTPASILENIALEQVNGVILLLD